MSAADEAREMLAMARKDLKAIRAMCGNEEFDDEIFAFHAQQAVEKALKSWISLLGLEYPLTHNLGILLALLEDHGCDAARFRDLAQYGIYAVRFRYEAVEQIDARLDRAETVREVAELVEYVQQLIGRSTS